jgi:hypothetical protein
MTDLRHFALALVVAILTLNASGLTALVVPEPCSATENADLGDSQCPPTCVRCGCCAQPAVPTPFEIVVSAELVTPQALLAASNVLPSVGRDILHVPKI